MVTCTNLQVQRFLYPNHETGEVIPTGLFLCFALRLRTDDPYGAKNFRKKSDQIFQFLGSWVSTQDIGQGFITSDFFCKSDPLAGEFQILNFLLSLCLQSLRAVKTVLAY